MDDYRRWRLFSVREEEDDMSVLVRLVKEGWNEWSLV